MSISDLSPALMSKLQILQRKLGASDIVSTIDQSINMAYFIAENINNPQSKILVERDGKFQELKGFS